MLDQEVARVFTAILSRLLPQISTTGGQSREERYDRRKPMTIPSTLEGNGAELQDSMMTYVLSKGKDMSTLIPAVIRMVYDYDPITSLWWSWKDYSDSTDDYDSVPESMKPLMREHNNQLYLDIKAAMQKTTANKALWTRINATHSLGRDSKHCTAEEGDGLGLFWMMIMLYRPSDEKYREKLEQDTYTLCRKIANQKGNPRKFIEEVRIKLEECDALGVHLKWMLTGKTLVTNLSTRNNVLAGKLIEFTKGDQVIDRDNCSVELGSICALVDEGMSELEDAGGGADRAMLTDKRSKADTPCNRGNKCFARNCPYKHDPSHDSKAAWEEELVKRGEKGGKGKGKGKGGSKGGSKKQRCKQQGCNEYQVKPYCNAHYRKWQESNSDTRGTKRAAKADAKAAKAEAKASNERKAARLHAYKAMFKEAKAIGAAKERKRAASAIADSDDEEEGFDWSRLNRSKSTGAPASVKAARRTKSKSSNAKSLQELLMEDSDDSM
jgi:hypothetical protein